MRKLTITLVGLLALVATSLAVAKGIQGAKTVGPVAATFSATASNVTTRTCTTTDNKAMAITDARYTGTASGDADLAGTITLRARSVINTTDNVGTVSGTFRIDVASGRDTTGSFSSVYANNAVAGLAVGRARTPGARLLGNISASFTPATGFTSGKIGGGTVGGAAVETGTGACRPTPPAHPEHSEARGAISALSDSSITVAGLTCAIPSDKTAAIKAKFHQSDVVEIRCDYTGGKNTLKSIQKRH